MTIWQRLWIRFMGGLIPHDEFQRGQGLLEYALIIILVGILLIVSLMLFSDELSGIYEVIIERLDAVAAT